MLIEDTRIKIKNFEEVKVGDVIRFVDDLDLSEFTYMVIPNCVEENGIHNNLICLDDGSFYYAKDKERVELLNTKLIIRK